MSQSRLAGLAPLTAVVKSASTIFAVPSFTEGSESKPRLSSTVFFASSSIAQIPLPR